MRIKHLIITTICLLLCSHVIGQNIDITIRFPIGDERINNTLLSNMESLLKIDSIIKHTDVDHIKSYTIIGSCSPDGEIGPNIKLSMQRAENTKALLLHLKQDIDNQKIKTTGIGVDWNKLQSLVKASDMLYKDEVLDIIKRVPDKIVNGTSRKKELMDLNYGRTWHYMAMEFFSEMRTSVITFVIEEPKKLQSADTLPQADIVTDINSSIADNSVTDETKQPEQQPLESSFSQVVAAVTEMPVNKAFALKTNLALLGVGVANIAVELSLSQHLSLNLPFVYTPYTINPNWKLRILAIQPEVRYWFGRRPLFGHFVGINSNVAFYNIAVDSDQRYQDKDGKSPLWSAGITYGYSVGLCRNLTLEFMIGAGYANIQYDVFDNAPNGALIKSDTRHYWGITNVGISLSYRFNKKSSIR